MSKILNVLVKIVLIISIVILTAIVLINVINIIRIMFFGMTVGGDYPDTIWWEKMTLKGFDGVKVFYNVWGDVVWRIELPIAIACIIYQIVYFKLIKNCKKEGKYE